MICGAGYEFCAGALVAVGRAAVGWAVLGGLGVLATGVLVTRRTVGLAVAGLVDVGLLRPIGVKVASGVIVGSITVVVSSVGCVVAVTTTN